MFANVTLNAAGTLTGTVFYGQRKQKLCFLTTMSVVRMPVPKITCMVEVEVTGAVFSPKALGTLLGYIAS